MNVPVWVTTLATAFWRDVGESEPFPRNLRRPIARAIQLTVVSMPDLNIAAMLKWLNMAGIVCAIKEDREVRACLVARRGVGIVFLNGSDSDAEQRVSLAHELGHFLRDYCYVRRKVTKRLGLRALAVLDGDRAATPQERTQAVVRRIALGFHVHLLARDPHGRPVSQAIGDAEACADRLAFELLAPAEHVGQALQKLGGQQSRLPELLETDYGLPPASARRYAANLIPQAKRHPLLLKLSGVK